MSEVNIWIAIKPFELDGVEYEKGDEWAQPPDWEYDKEYASQTAIGGRATFVHEYVQGHEYIQEGGQGPKVKKPIIGFKRHLLPVKRK